MNVFNSLGYLPRCRTAGSDGNSILTIYGNAISSSEPAEPFYNPTRIYEGPDFSPSSPTLLII